jgi:hypothetical protein
MVIAALVVVDLVLATLAWRDLNRRSEVEVRGTKRFWRVVILANPGNSIAYWLFGRKRVAEVPESVPLH